MTSYHICLFLWGLFHLVWSSLGLSLLLQMALFHSFFMTGKYSIVYMYQDFIILSSINGHLSCFHILAIVSSTMMNTAMHVSFQIIVFSRYMPRSDIAGSYSNSIFSIVRHLWASLASTIIYWAYIIWYTSFYRSWTYW